MADKAPKPLWRRAWACISHADTLLSISRSWILPYWPYAAGGVLMLWSWLDQVSLPIAITVGVVAFAAIQVARISTIWLAQIRPTKRTGDSDEEVRTGRFCMFAFPANAMQPTTDNAHATMSRIKIGNVDRLTVCFGGDVEQSIGGNMPMPPAFDFQKVIFAAEVVPDEPSPERQCAFKFYHTADPSGEYKCERLFAQPVKATKHQCTVLKWERNAKDLGWVPNEVVDFKLMRDLDIESNLPGKLHLVLLRIYIEVA